MMYCVAATVDTGLIDEVVPLETAINKVVLGYHILPGTITSNKTEAEKALRKWKRSPRKLSKELDRLTI
jgi:hypothetical protein